MLTLVAFLLALGVLTEAQTRSLAVPQQLAVVGFGNSTIAGDMRPTITTVDIDGARIAREAIAAIRRRAAGSIHLSASASSSARSPTPSSRCCWMTPCWP